MGAQGQSRRCALPSAAVIRDRLPHQLRVITKELYQIARLGSPRQRRATDAVGASRLT